MWRLAIYTRVSSADRQGDNFSIPSQLQVIRVWAKAQGYEIVAEFVEKTSAWRDGLDRAELGKALALAREGKIDVLMFYEPSRFTRDMADGVILRRELRRCNVTLMCYMPTPHQVTSDQEIMNILVDWQSQEFVEKQREASMRGYREKAESGLFNGPRPPYGYEIIGRQHATQLAIVEHKAETVRQIFHWFVFDRLGTREIARRLTQDGIPTPAESSGFNQQYQHGSGEWNASMIGRILSNETYAGTWYAFRYIATQQKKQSKRRPESDWIPITVPIIIERAVWEMARERRERRGDHIRNVKHFYLMRGRTTCGCGAAVQGTLKKGSTWNIRYYRCSSAATIKGKCGAPHFRCDDVDAIVWQFVKDLLNDSARVLQGYRDAQASVDTELTVRREQIGVCDEQIAEQSCALAETIEMRQKTRVQAVKDALDQQIEQIGMLIEQLQERRASLVTTLNQGKLTDAHIQEVIAITESIKATVQDIEQCQDDETKRRLVEAFNIRCTVRVAADGEQWVDVHWLLETMPFPVKRASGCVCA